jgi:hypothetical protein
VEHDPGQACTCDGEQISRFNGWLGEREGEARVRIQFECCKCGRIAVVRIMDTKEDQ